MAYPTGDGDWRLRGRPPVSSVLRKETNPAGFEAGATPKPVEVVGTLFTECYAASGQDVAQTGWKRSKANRKASKLSIEMLRPPR
jgi:hypothetical protein